MTNPDGKGKWEEMARKVLGLVTGFYSFSISNDCAEDYSVKSIAQALAQVEMETIEKVLNVVQKLDPLEAPSDDESDWESAERTAEIVHRYITKAIRAMGKGNS